MMRRSLRATTIMEIMVVVLIVSLVVGGVMSSLVAPMKELRVAETELAHQSAKARLYVQLVEDAHQSISVAKSTNPNGVLFQTSGNTGIAYVVDPEGILRRSELPNADPLLLVRRTSEAPSSGAPLLQNVSRIDLSNNASGLFRTLQIEGNTVVFDRSEQYAYAFDLRMMEIPQ